MATYSPSTGAPAGGSDDRGFHADAAAFDVVLDALHAAIHAEALVGPDPFDPAMAGLAREASDAWTACEDTATRFLDRPALRPHHVMAAEHLLDVLRSDGFGEVHAFVVPAALERAALRCARQRDLPSAILSRQLSNTGSALSLIIEEARAASETVARDDPSELPPAA
jgi:hypothetical protein